MSALGDASKGAAAGVLSSIMPYVAVGVIGYFGYRYLEKKGVIAKITDDLGQVGEAAADLPTQAVKFFKDKTAVGKASSGDWAGAAETIIKTSGPAAAILSVIDEAKPPNPIDEAIKTTSVWDDAGSSKLTQSELLNNPTIQHRIGKSGGMKLTTFNNAGKGRF